MGMIVPLTGQELTRVILLDLYVAIAFDLTQ